MKKLFIPQLSISPRETILEKIALLKKTGAKADIDQINWKTDFPKTLPVIVWIAHDNDKFFLYYEIENEMVRAANTRDFGSVWEDSCVEFFMQKEGETHYRNFECNILGVLLASDHETREKSEKMSEEIMQSIVRFSTIQQKFKDGNQLCDWTMYLEIPKNAMGFSDQDILSGKTIKANFYKCGDETPEPHFISWNPIDLPKPNFHVPEFFGTLELE